jgi:hypothetical protein
MIEDELKNLRGDSGNTSVDSLMEDTPSNYNQANQRFDSDPDSDIEVDANGYFIGADGRKRKKRKAKKKRTDQSESFDPRDKKMAKVYGTERRKKSSRRGSVMESSKGMGKLYKVANSISGYQDPNTMEGDDGRFDVKH